MRFYLPALSLLLFACSSRFSDQKNADPDDGIKDYNNDPSADITSHEEGAEILEGYDIIFRGSVADDNHQNTELTVTWLTDLRELCPAQAPVADGSTTCIAKIEREEKVSGQPFTSPSSASSFL